ncbi:MAG: FAD-dependent oxidoreductase [Anaerolineaceae bacterium]|nr:FAD-dependent oxidoreductase [Anaerolineaceae bacterium]
MAKLTIDGREVEAPEGATVLEAARRLGIEIPTLCYLKGLEPHTSCFVCVVQVDGYEELKPSCSMPAAEGMVVRTDSDDVRRARRMAVELLLSDHPGDCVAPCSLACPAHLDVADFIARIAAGDSRRALQIVKQRIPLPASLARVCPRFCEGVCRRKDLDQPVNICDLRRYVADLDLASPDPYVPQRAADTGKRVAVVGGGPAGLSAAYYLQAMGHACTIFEAADRAGGLFRSGLGRERLPGEVLDGEIGIVLRLGTELRTGVRLGDDVTLDELRSRYDAVLLAMGTQARGDQAETCTARRAHSAEVASATKAGEPLGRTTDGPATGDVEFDLSLLEKLGLETTRRGARVDRRTMMTSLGGVFAAGNLVSGPNYGVHAIAAGRRAAVAIDQFLRQEPVVGHRRRVNVLMRDLGEDELARLGSFADPAPRVALQKNRRGGTSTMSDDEALAEAGRCLDCDCGKRRSCRLRLLAERFGASATRFRGPRRSFERDLTHAEIVYESGKCIQCGRCVRVSEQAREQLGLTFIGRGFSVRTAAPFSTELSEALRLAARRCAEVCPTGAISLKRFLRDGGR